MIIDEYLRKHDFAVFSPKAVLFDMDGVLYDSMKNHSESWHKAMAHYGLNMSRDDAYMYEGMRGVETIKLLARQQWGKELSEEEAQEMYAEKSRCFNNCNPAGVMNGVKELMRKIKACGLKIVVVTGSGQRTLLDKLEKDFEGLVTKELMITAFDVKHGKPNPEPYIRGMEKADIKAWEGIVVENAPLGVRAAVAAGLFTVAVNTGPLPDSKLLDEGADMIYPDMPTFNDDWDKLFKLKP